MYLPEEEAELGGRAIGVVEAPRVRSLAAGPESEADYMRDENRCQIFGMMHLNPPRAPLTKCHCLERSWWSKDFVLLTSLRPFHVWQILLGRVTRGT